MRHERNPEYQQFLDTVNGRKDGQYDPEEETSATRQEIGWWKRHQISRALGQYGTGFITAEALHLIESHINFHVSPRQRQKQRAAQYS